MDEEVAACEEVDHALIGDEQWAAPVDEAGVAVVPHEEFIICRVTKDNFIDLELEADCRAWVVGVVGVDDDVSDLKGDPFFDVFKDEGGFNVIEPHGEIGISEHVGEELFGRFLKADRGPDGDLAFGVVEGAEKGESGDVVPVGVADEKIDFFGIKFAHF